MRLSLRSNPIVRLPTAAFEHTPDLVVSTKSFSPLHSRIDLQLVSFFKSLDLGHCRLDSIAGAVLRRLTKLEYLRLDGNQLQTLSPVETFPTMLR